MIQKIFKYIEPLWLGQNKKISIRRVLAIAFSVDFISNMSYIVHRWELGKSYADVAMLLGIEAGLIAALMSLTTYSAALLTKKQDENDCNNEPPVD